MAKVKSGAVGGSAPTNGGENDIATGVPYTVVFKLRGTCDLLFHRWNCEAVAEKANAHKGSKSKKSDNIESYVYRDESGQICLPGEYVRQSICVAAKSRQDPRSPRKSAMDLFKAGLVCLTELSSMGKEHWDYEHAARVQIQRNGITRIRPAIRSGWEAKFRFCVLMPEFIWSDLLEYVLVMAGKTVGVAY